MITLKFWNSLSKACRQAILRLIANNGYYNNKLADEYHHAFGFDSIGTELEELLHHVYKDKNGDLRIEVYLKPTFTPSEEQVKSIQKKQKKNNYPVQHRYYFRAYRANDEDGENLWADAYSEQEARNQIYDDNWGIETLDLIKVV